MGRLSSAKSRLTTTKPRLGNGLVPEADRTRHRDQTQSYRAWYKTARWQRLRLNVLLRDGYVCQATGVALIGVYPSANSPVVDHKVPHRGDAGLFWDEKNLQSVAKGYHDKVKQGLEARGQY